MAAHLLFGEGEEVLACKGNGTSDLRGGREEAQESERGGGFAGAGLAYES